MIGLEHHFEDVLPNAFYSLTVTSSADNIPRRKGQFRR